MPVKISGDGTITGLTVGGLPNGVVDEDTLATDSVTNIKVANNAINTNEIVNNAVTPAKSTIASGITHLDRWFLTSGFSGEKNPVDSNLARGAISGMGLIGDPMTQSSGIFTFPATGIWRIYTQREAYLNADDREVRIIIVTTLNNWTSDYNSTENATHISRSESQNTHVSQTASYTFDVTDTSQCKVKFRYMCNNNSTFTIAEASKQRTYFGFMRIGDT